VKGIGASLDVLIDLFERIGTFFRRIEDNLDALLTTAMMDVLIRILAEILSILATATMKVKPGSRGE
jgi:hypothetical protein